MSDYTNEGQQRILRLVFTVLPGNVISGIAPAEIARQQNCSASIVTRDLQNLKAAGLAEQVPETMRWRLSPEAVQVSTRHMVEMDRARQRLDDITKRYSRGTADHLEVHERLEQR